MGKDFANVWRRFNCGGAVNRVAAAPGAPKDFCPTVLKKICALNEQRLFPLSHNGAYPSRIFSYRSPT